MQIIMVNLFQVRQELKKYSEWPTYPQLYVKGELIGGLDILKEMSESADAVGGIPLIEQLGLSETLLQLPIDLIIASIFIELSHLRSITLIFFLSFFSISFWACNDKYKPLP